MSTIKLISAESLERDGTSQLGRSAFALSPDYVSVDERKTEDIIAFVHALGKTLVHYGREDQPDGDFSGFVGSLAPDIVAAYLRNPSQFDAIRYPALFRPHFALFLAFLRLLQDAQADLNTLTRRHLNFYYRRFLRMQSRSSVPDRVNLLFSLAARENRTIVPAGTAVSAGADDDKKDQLYRTSRDLIVNRARIEKVSSLYVERDIIRIQQAWRNDINEPDDGRFEMLRIAYGRPRPGDALPPLPILANGTVADAGTLDTKLKSIATFVRFSTDMLKLTLPKLREAMAISTAAIAAGPAPTNNSAATALQNNRKQKYKSIIDDAARTSNHAFVPPTTTTTFDAYANLVFGNLVISGYTAITTVRLYWDALLKLEDYFAMPIERFHGLLDAFLFDSPQWRDACASNSASVASILEEAHHEKLRAGRIAELTSVRTRVLPPRTGVPTPPPPSSYTAMLQYTLGDEVNGYALDAELEDRLRVYLTEPDVKSLGTAAAALRWNDVTALLAHAIGARIGRKPPAKEVWLNLFPAEDARKVLSTRGTAGTRAIPFLTFGAPGPINTKVAPASVVGFALTSPVLALAGGERTITITLGLDSSADDIERLKVILLKFGLTAAIDDTTSASLSPLVFEVSTENGWLRCGTTTQPTIAAYRTLLALPAGQNPEWKYYLNAQGLQIKLVLPKEAPPIVPLASPPDGLDSRFPVLRMLMQPVWDATANRFVTWYRELSSLFVGAVHIKVDVAGLLPSALENDDSTLDPKKPFEPFGVMPAPGSRLLIGHPEVVTKKLDKLAFSCEWMGAPKSLSVHYKNYGLNLDNTPFTTTLSSVAEMGTTIIANTAQLFGFNTDPDKTTITTRKFPDSGNLPSVIAADFSPVAKGAYGPRVSTWRRYLRWELGNTDFQHRTYPAVAAQKALEFSIAKPTNISEAVNYKVPPPYTPKLKTLTLDYSSSVEFSLFRQPIAERLDRAYHVHPFGVAELFTSSGTEELPFVPQYDKASELYIGLSGVVLPETVTLLFQLDEGTADRDVPPPEVTFSQLSGNRFLPLGHNVLSDATRGLQRSGVVELALTQAEPSTILPQHLTWIRLSVPQDMPSICDVLALHTQAVEAVFDDQGNAPSHYRSPLPGETITSLLTGIAGIVGVAQPYSSYGGRLAEDETTFSTRVSERLRHKQRALSSWDYERLVLDAFPEIFKTKCIPAGPNNPGVVDMLVIPDVRAVPTNEFGPKAPIALLSAIQAHLAVRVPACVDVRTRNPNYRAVRLRLGVRFAERGNEAFWMGRLNDELNRFLSPWAYEEGADLVIGSRIHSSNIIEFVDRRSYVDYVAGVTLFYTDDEGLTFTFLRPPEDTGPYFVEAGGVDRALVAFPQHRVDVLVAEHYDAKLYMGISYMEIEMDFVVG